MKYFLKNNNNPTNTGVSYYNVGTTFKYNGWECDVKTDFAGCGHTLWVNSSHQKLLGQPSVGDRILIYQKITKASKQVLKDQVLTHVVECVGSVAHRFSDHFPEEGLAITILEDWKFTRKMKILAVLKPSVFGGKNRGQMQLYATKIHPDVLKITEIVDSISEESYGRVYPAPKTMLSESELKDKLTKSGFYSISETW